MKKILLTMIMAVSMSLTASAGDVKILVYPGADDGGDGVQFQIKGKGSSCTGWMGPSGEIEQTTCEQIPMNGRNYLCTSNGKLCKNQSKLLGVIFDLVNG